ncbi:MAG TPA: outer membrane protein assembly factor BamD [Nitrospirota bacterium]|nr:outer membrane protein assembly factor BamD [Nitrospirota bacterium]
MKKNLLIVLFVLLAGCASFEPPYDTVRTFNEAEQSMRKEDYEGARKYYQKIQERSPDKSYDALIMLRIADTYYGEEKYSEALVEYQNFLNYHPVHKDAPYAQYQIAMCNYRQLVTIDRDPTPAHAVIREMKKLLEKYPRSGYEDEAKQYIAICRDWIAEYELYVAHFYYKIDAYKAAIGRCEKLLQDYPGSSAEKDALYYAALSYLKLNERGQARDKLETLAQKYPAMKGTAVALLRKLPTP